MGTGGRSENSTSYHSVPEQFAFAVTRLAPAPCDVYQCDGVRLRGKRALIMILQLVGSGTLAVALVISTACGSDPLTIPTSIDEPTVLPSPTPPRPSFPDPSGPSRVFTFARGVAPHVMDDTRHSQFSLYDNGAFALRYVSTGAEYRGGYTEADGVITFEWEGWSRAGPWMASATLTSDTLSVRYNTVMQLTDFEDAVYRLAS